MNLLPLRCAGEAGAQPRIGIGAVLAPRDVASGEAAVFYREAGQYKTTYAADMAIFPIRQDRYGVALILSSRSSSFRRSAGSSSSTR